MGRHYATGPIQPSGIICPANLPAIQRRESSLKAGVAQAAERNFRKVEVGISTISFGSSYILRRRRRRRTALVRQPVEFKSPAQIHGSVADRQRHSAVYGAYAGSIPVRTAIFSGHSLRGRALGFQPSHRISSILVRSNCSRV